MPTLEERLDRLERQNRTLKRRLSLLVLLTLSLVAGGLYYLVAIGPEVIKAKAFHVVDDDGNVLVKMEDNRNMTGHEQGRPAGTLTTFDEKGQIVVQLGAGWHETTDRERLNQYENAFGWPGWIKIEGGRGEQLVLVGPTEQRASDEWQDEMAKAEADAKAKEALPGLIQIENQWLYASEKEGIEAAMKIWSMDKFRGDPNLRPLLAQAIQQWARSMREHAALSKEAARSEPDVRVGLQARMRSIELSIQGSLAKLHELMMKVFGPAARELFPPERRQFPPGSQR